jgi:hypothetical protein
MLMAATTTVHYKPKLTAKVSEVNHLHMQYAQLAYRKQSDNCCSTSMLLQEPGAATRVQLRLS